MLRSTIALLVFATTAVAQHGQQSGAYEQELRRRQYEYQQQQMLRQQQAQV